MRPGKRVMLYCADYERRNDLAFVLRVRCPGARIEAFGDVEEMREHLRDSVTNAPLFDCVLVIPALPSAMHRLSEQIDLDFLFSDAEIAGYSIELRVKNDVAWSALATRWVTAGDIAALLEQIRMASARKRGPKKQVRQLAGAVA